MAENCQEHHSLRETSFYFSAPPHTSTIKLQTGLFSASVAVLLAVTVLDLKRNPQDTAVFYLENMYKLQVLADPNISRPFIPSTPVQLPPFSPPKYAIWVNSLWFSSLAISLTCAMLATLLQQWARRYLRVTQPPRYTPQHRARIRAFYEDGVDKLRLSWAVRALPSMIHFSLFLFFAGLLIYLFNVSHPVFFAVVWWVGISTVAYLGITVMPIFWLESPYYTPLTSIFGLLRNAEKMAEKAVEKMGSKIDGRILEWTWDRLVEDHELEEFFGAIPGFVNDMVDGSLSPLAKLRDKLSSALFHFLFRTVSSNSLSESEKNRRFVIGVKAADAARLSEAVRLILSYTSFRLWDITRCSAEMAESLKSGDKNGHKETNLCAQSVVALIIAHMQESDHGLVTLTLATDQLRDGLSRYLPHGKDSVLLANLIHITRLIFHSLGDNRDVADTSSKAILPSLCKFNIRNARPELQDEFCALWREIVSDVQNSENPDSAIQILVRIRHLYIDLHQGTDAAPTVFDASTADDDPILLDPFSYPLRHPSDHHPRVDHNALGEPAHDLATPTTPVPPTHVGTLTTDKSSSGNVPETPTRLIPVTTSSGIIDIPSPAILRFTFTRGAALQPNEETLTVTVSPAVIPGLPSSPLLRLMPAPSSALRRGPHPPAESSVNESDRIPDGPVPSSSSTTTAFSRVAPQVASSPDHEVTTAIPSQQYPGSERSC